MKHEKKKGGRGGGKSNTDRLSQGKKIAAHKKLLKAKRAEECTFDSAARADFLTGFHKRKMERRNKAALKNKELERTSQLAMRADLRQQRKAELQQRLEAHRAELGLLSDNEHNDDEWHGFSGDDGDDGAPKSKQDGGKSTGKQGLWELNEYEDDEKTISVEISEM